MPMVTSVIIRIELKGYPTISTYRDLHKFMTAHGWLTTMTGDSEVVANLPHATYAGETDLPIMEFAASLRASIQSSIWSTAKVFVVAWSAWAMDGASL